MTSKTHKHKHNPDTNPDWTPLMKQRVYKCEVCGHEHKTTTNHTGACYPICKGKCRQILHPHTPHEIVMHRQTKHVYVKDA